MANPPNRYQPPGPRTDPLVHLYDLFYQSQDQASALQEKLTSAQQTITALQQKLASISGFGPSGVKKGTYGNASQVGQFTVNDEGILTFAQNVNIVGGGGSGTVTSVALSVPAGFTVSGSPVTTAGTLALGVASASWTAPTLLNSWANFGSGNIAAGYLKDPFNYACVQGFVNAGTTSAGVVVFTLPSGFRPTATQYFACPWFTSSGVVSTTPGVIAVLATGDVTLYGVSSNFGVGLNCRFPTF